MMATSNPYRPPPGANDWTARLPPGSPSADQGMVATPYTDPGYAMPNPYIGNLNQSPGMAVGGYLLANQLLDPNQVQGQTTMQNRLAPWSNWDDYAGNDQIAKEQLPPWDNDPSLLPPRLTWEQQIAASRPADYNIDPRMQANPGYYTPRSFKVWHGGTVRTPGAVSTYQDPGEFPTMRWLLPAAREQTD